MTTRPTDAVPNWADTGTRTTPSSGKRTLGWIFTDPPPFDFVNWFWGVTADWVLHLSTTAAKFAKLEDAANALAVGDTAIVDEWDGASFPGQSLTTVATGNAVTTIDCDGRAIAYGDGPGTLVLKSRADLTTDVNAAAFVPTVAGVIRRVLTDGKFVAIAKGDRVEIFDPDAGGAFIWSFDHGAAVQDIAMDGTHLYLVGVANAGISARAIILEGGGAGTSAWDFNHGATLEAVATDGRRVFMAGAASSHASLATMRALNAVNGFDLTNEGGTGLDVANIAWNVIDANGPSTRGQLGTDGRGLLVCGQGGGATRLQTRAAGDGSAIATVLATAGVPSIAVDQHYAYAMDPTGGTNGLIYAFEKHTLALAWISESDEDYLHVATDGGAVFGALNSTAPFEVEKLARGNDARLWRRVDPADDYLRMRQLIVPAD